MKIYKRYCDPGHAWLAVPIEALRGLGIAPIISAYSYKRGKTAYLEEDLDMPVFCKAYERSFSEKPMVRTIFTKRNRQSKIRSYESFREDFSNTDLAYSFLRGTK